MISLQTVSVASIALMLAATPAFAQAEQATQPSATPPQNEGAPASSGATAMGSDAMRQMVREMMMEMMRDGSLDQGRREGRKEWRKGMHRDHADRRGGRQMGVDDGWRGQGMRSGMMHGTGMRMIFAIVDADGDGALSLAEVQDFHGRIFKAADQNKDGKVEMTEIQTFFHGTPDEVGDDDAN